MNEGKDKKPLGYDSKQTHSKPTQPESSLAKLTEPGKSKNSVGVAAKLRNYFFTGLIVVGPIAITLYSVWTVVTWIDGWVKPHLPNFPSIPGKI